MNKEKLALQSRKPTNKILFGTRETVLENNSQMQQYKHMKPNKILAERSIALLSSAVYSWPVYQIGLSNTLQGRCCIGISVCKFTQTTNKSCFNKVHSNENVLIKADLFP